MEATYSITVHNKYSLALDEDEDPLEVLKIREAEKEAKKKEKLSEKENKSKQPETQKSAGTKTQKSRVIKDAQQHTPKIQESKKDQVEKKPSQPRTGGDRNLKFSGESREERNNKRNREDGERQPRNQMDNRRGPPGEHREQREPREPREPRDFRGPGDNSRPDFGERRGGRGGSRGGGMNRGRGGSRGGRGGFDNRGKREFDRQSGSDKTGVKPVDKKDGAGSHNWGTHNDEIEESLNQESQDWDAEKPEIDLSTPATTEAAKEGEVANTSTEEKPIEEESREITLDEWKAKQGTRAKPQYNLRKAGEGEDLSRWKKMYALEKKKEGEEEDEDDEEYDATEYPQRVGRQKRVFDIDIQFSDNRRGGSGRGGRGGRGGRSDRANGGRGFGNRGGAPRDTEPRAPVVSVEAPQAEQRSPRGRQNAPKVDDENDFPSLG
ncbi:plasminogen activator inhibitor 1 RNA-binding protein-like isoform X2 [Leptopilina boulardi]|uniref:plasminogen activator inhibitor 1 RNA-binding protein-like isoform X2 n=1 Tax=Leptopilina boulardi TaxID=63433 RepID=UPI0021F5323D|nr:plasminogen activator inhibitor 1 RNA-binding protein-like isoform X2 [Leptopilina boulardi]